MTQTQYFQSLVRKTRSIWFRAIVGAALIALVAAAVQRFRGAVPAALCILLAGAAIGGAVLVGSGIGNEIVKRSGVDPYDDEDY